MQSYIYNKNILTKNKHTSIHSVQVYMFFTNVKLKKCYKAQE